MTTQQETAHQLIKQRTVSTDLSVPLEAPIAPLARFRSDDISHQRWLREVRSYFGNDALFARWQMTSGM